MKQDSGFLYAGRHRLEYRWLAARGAGLPAVVLLRPGLGSAAIWRDLPGRLAERTGCGVLS